MKKKKLIINLIANDLINYRLVDGLYRQGIDASAYYGYLAEVALKLMGFTKDACTTELYEQYTALAEKVHDFNLEALYPEAKTLAREIYVEMKQRLGAQL